MQVTRQAVLIWSGSVITFNFCSICSGIRINKNHAGIGSLFVTAIQSNDYNVVLAISFVYSLLYIGMMLIVDILYCVIDPRIRLAKEG